MDLCFPAGWLAGKTPERFEDTLQSTPAFFFCTATCMTSEMYLFSSRPASRKKRWDKLKNTHSTLVSKFCAIDLHERDLGFSGRPVGQKNHQDELKTHTFYTRV
jgi:hypothetical protein